MVDWQLITDLTTGVVGTTLMFFVGKKLRQPPEVRLSFENRDAFRTTYLKWRAIEGPIVLAGMTIASFGWFFLLNTLAKLAFARQNLGVIVVTPDPAYWGLIAIFLGIVSSITMLEDILKRLLGDRYAEYCEISGARNGRKALRVFEAIIYPVAIIAILLGFRTYTAFGEEAITFQSPFWADKQTYRYDRIRRLVHVVPVQSLDQPREILDSYAIRFDDGFLWTTRMFLRDPDDERDPGIIEFVATRCGRPIQVIASLDEIRP